MEEMVSERVKNMFEIMSVLRDRMKNSMDIIRFHCPFYYILLVSKLVRFCMFKERDSGILLGKISQGWETKERDDNSNTISWGRSWAVARGVMGVLHATCQALKSGQDNRTGQDEYVYWGIWPAPRKGKMPCMLSCSRAIELACLSVGEGSIRQSEGTFRKQSLFCPGFNWI